VTEVIVDLVNVLGVLEIKALSIALKLGDE